MGRRIAYLIVLLIQFAGSVLFLQSCCGLGQDDGYYNQVYTTYKYEIHLADTSDHFKSVTFNNSSIVQQSDTNYLEWKIFIRPPQTTIYVETEKGRDTVTYEVTVTAAKYETDKCSGGESVKMTISDPVVVKHTFDSAYIVRKTTSLYYGPNYQTITTILRLKN